METTQQASKREYQQEEAFDLEKIQAELDELHNKPLQPLQQQQQRQNIIRRLHQICE